jgi:hypothetical protein
MDVKAKEKASHWDAVEEDDGNGNQRTVWYKV